MKIVLINGLTGTGVYVTKFPGVLLDCRMPGKEHTDLVKNKLTKCLAIIYKESIFLTELMLRVIAWNKISDNSVVLYISTVVKFILLQKFLECLGSNVLIDSVVWRKTYGIS